MKINKLVLKNFLSYKDTTIIFDNNIIQFIGVSGSGKTTILEALLFLFYNRFPRGGSGILTKNAKESRVEAEIEYNGKQYILSTVRTKRSKNFIIRDLESNTSIVNTTQFEEYRQVLSNLFGKFFAYNYSDILDMIFCSSTTIAKKFPLNMVDLLLDDEVLDKYKKIFKKEEKDFYDKIRQLDGQISELERRYAKLQNTKTSKYSLNEILEKIEEIQEHLNKVTQQKNEALQEQVKVLTDKKEKEKTIKKYEKLLSLKKCPTCGRSLSQKDIITMTAFIDTQKNELEDYTKQLHDLEKQIRNLTKEEQRLNKELYNWKAERQIAKTQAQNKEKELQDIQTRIKKLQEKRDKYDIYVKSVQEIIKIYNKKIIPSIRKHIVTILLSQVKNLARNLFEQDVNIEMEDDLYITIGKTTIPYDLLSRGEKTRIYLSFLIVIHQLLSLPFGLLIDELLDALDVENYYKVLNLLKSSNIAFVWLTTTKLNIQFEGISQILVEQLNKG